MSSLRESDIDDAAQHLLKAPKLKLRRFDTSLKFITVYPLYPLWYRLEWIPIARVRICLHRRLKAIWISRSYNKLYKF